MYCFEYTQKLPISIEECWDFFSKPENLQTITPEYLKFDMPSKPHSEMYAGQIIEHILQPLWGISFEWVTEITHVHAPYYFIDEQRFGPYRFWHHEHRFKSIANGVEMDDIIHYKLPYGPIGKLIHFFKVQKDLEKIFSYRYTKLENLFGIYSENKL